MSLSSLHVIGVGNRYRSDDAVGILLAEQLRQTNTQLAQLKVSLWEDADALTIAHGLLECDQPTLVVDCADMGLDAGASRLFTESSLKGTHTVSTHGFGMQEAIALARALGFQAPLWLYGVQPRSLDSSNTLSTELQQQFKALLSELQQRVRELVLGAMAA